MTNDAQYLQDVLRQAAKEVQRPSYGQLVDLCREAAVLIAGIPNAYDSDRLMAAKLNDAVAKAEAD